MRGMRRARRHRHSINADINLVNLIDVSFVLLIIFMIAAPMLQGGIDLTLPSAESAPASTTDPITVSVTADGKYYVNEAEVQIEELGEIVASMRGDSKRDVVLRGDKAVTLELFMPVVGILVQRGIEDVTIMTEQKNGG